MNSKLVHLYFLPWDVVFSVSQGTYMHFITKIKLHKSKNGTITCMSINGSKVKPRSTFNSVTQKCTRLLKTFCDKLH